MKTFRNYLRLAAAIGILSITLVLTTADLTPLLSAVPAPVAQVFVTNTSTDPVPTLAQGTTTVGGTVSAAQSGPWSVDINGMPNVNAAQSGLWSVGLTGTADVNVANSPDVGAFQRGMWSVALSGPVSLDRGAPGTPLSVLDAGNPAKQPVQMDVFVTIPVNQTVASVGGPSVPMGKRLVIEHVSVTGSLPQGQKVACSVFVRDPLSRNGILVGHGLPVSFLGTFGEGASPQPDVFQASQPIRLYADHTDLNPSTIGFQAERTASAGTAGFTFSFSGYLVDVP
jgi:hypothetical protein